MTPTSSFFTRARRILGSGPAWLVMVALVLVTGVGSVLVGLNPALAAAVLLVVLIVGLTLLARPGLHRSTGADGAPARLGIGTVVAHAGVAVVATLALIQMVPYGRAHANPAGTGEPAWATPRTRELMVGACFGCHSNEVEWPWYASVAPISWAITEHVDEGRGKVNYSEFATDPGEADDTIEVIQEGEMPPGYYTRFGLHPEANLSEAEVAELIAGLAATAGMGEGGREGGGEGGDED